MRILLGVAASAAIVPEGATLNLYAQFILNWYNSRSGCMPWLGYRLSLVMGAFPDGEAALMLTTARLRYVADTA